MKSMRLILLILFGMALSCRCLSNEEANVVNVSMISLLANSNAMEGKAVRVTGFLLLGEVDMLFLSEADYLNVLCDRAFGLQLEAGQKSKYKLLSLKYVTVEAIFHRGVLEHVQDIAFYSDPKRPRAKFAAYEPYVRPATKEELKQIEEGKPIK